jgi:hypothetical protein
MLLGKHYFYRKNPGLAMAWGFAFLLVFLRGVLENVGVWTWFFDGENVVECVVNVVIGRSIFWR